MKILNIVLAVLFVIFAVVQLNDPDPWAWVSLYLLVAGVAGFAAFGKYNRYVIWAGLAVSIIWLGILIPEFVRWVQMGMPSITESMKAEEPHIEYTREFLGLFLCIGLLVFEYFQYLKANKSTS